MGVQCAVILIAVFQLNGRIDIIKYRADDDRSLIGRSAVSRAVRGPFDTALLNHCVDGRLVHYYRSGVALAVNSGNAVPAVLAVTDLRLNAYKTQRAFCILCGQGKAVLRPERS